MKIDRRNETRVQIGGFTKGETADSMIPKDSSLESAVFSSGNFASRS